MAALKNPPLQKRICHHGGTFVHNQDQTVEASPLPHHLPTGRRLMAHRLSFKNLGLTSTESCLCLHSKYLIWRKRFPNPVDTPTINSSLITKPQEVHLTQTGFILYREDIQREVSYQCTQTRRQGDSCHQPLHPCPLSPDNPTSTTVLLSILTLSSSLEHSNSSYKPLPHVVEP